MLINIWLILVNKCYLVKNKIEINKNIKSIINNIYKERIPSREFIRNDNSSLKINNKNEKLFELKSRSNKNVPQENVANVAYFSRKHKSSFKLFESFKNINRRSIFWYFICPFLFLKRTTKLKYFAQLEDNFNNCFSIENFLKLLEIN